MPKKRLFVMTISGLDPTAGAGIYADIKSFENLKIYGVAVPTANTIQSENEFLEPNWIPFEIIEKQILLLFENYKIKYCKIGIVQNFDVLEKIVNLLYNKGVKIILDTVLKATSGFEFHNENDVKQLKKVFEKCELITPNYEEFISIFGENDIEKNALKWSEKTNIYLKGGHRKNTDLGKDELYTNGNKFVFVSRKKNIYPKHGSGCVLSSVITAYLSRGFLLQKSCLKAKKYIDSFLSSNSSLLGWHRIS